MKIFDPIVLAKNICKCVSVTGVTFKICLSQLWQMGSSFQLSNVVALEKGKKSPSHLDA